MNTLTSNPVLSLPETKKQMTKAKPRRRLNANQLMWLLKPLGFLLMLLPFAYLLFTLLTGQLGPNPIDEITDFTGEWALRFILLGLALTPIKLVFKQTWPLRFRRMVGLFAFFYLMLHIATYVALDLGFDLAAVFSDVLERRYITAGFLAFIILLPLAITSNRAMVKRLGKKWQALHRWVYLAATASVVHYIWLARGEVWEPKVYLGILLVLLSVRLFYAIKKPTRAKP